MTESQMSAADSPRFEILLEVVPEDEQESNPVTIGEVSRSIMRGLRQEGYAVETVYQGFSYFERRRIKSESGYPR